MRYGIFGDVHGHLAAMEQAIALLETEGAEIFLCTGDLIGFLGDSSGCVKLAQKRCTAVVAGNHEHVTTDATPADAMSRVRRAYQKAYASRLSPDQLRWTKNLPLVARCEGFTVTHGSMDHPENFNYVLTPQDVDACFSQMELPLVFIGHTHIPFVFLDTRPVTIKWPDSTPALTLDPACKTIVNVGSVGEPRTKGAPSCCVLYDSDLLRVRFLRFPTPKAASSLPTP
ncbi:MAG: metallophosphatase family protein [Planctomycetes bacterium]|nr:metallophosphatase family protein [Planctomycetota bacterium]